MHSPPIKHTPAAIDASTPAPSSASARARTQAPADGTEIASAPPRNPFASSAPQPTPLDALARPALSAAQSCDATVPPIAQRVSPPIAERIDQARDLRNQNKFSESLLLLGDDAALGMLDRSELSLWRGKVFQFAKDSPAALTALAEAAMQAESIRDPLAKRRQLAYVVFQEGMARRAASDLGGAIQKFSQAEPHLRAVGQNALYALAERCDMYHNLAFILDQRGMNEEAMAAYKALLPLRVQAGQPQPLGYTKARLGLLQCQLGERGEGLDNLRAGIELIDQHGSRAMAQDYRTKLAALPAD